jgi:hypothetical protein
VQCAPRSRGGGLEPLRGELVVGAGAVDGVRNEGREQPSRPRNARHGWPAGGRTQLRRAPVRVAPVLPCSQPLAAGARGGGARDPRDGRQGGRLGEREHVLRELRIYSQGLGWAGFVGPQFQVGFQMRGYPQTYRMDVSPSIGCVSRIKLFIFKSN